MTIVSYILAAISGICFVSGLALTAMTLKAEANDDD